MNLKCFSKSLIFLISFFISFQSISCTIFILTDSKRTLFFNNEDYSNPSTRIWFIPAGKDYYGCVYVGFDNGWPQGGANTEGLAYDWVAGNSESYEPAQEMLQTKGNPNHRMLETCKSVDEAIEFYKKYKDPSFSNAKILIADKTGASVIIGAKDGKLYFDKSNESRGFGYGNETLKKTLPAKPKPTVENGITILQACMQEGQYATKYSNVFDLKSGDIVLLTLPKRENEVTLNILTELKKGKHYYDIPKIKEQLKQPTLDLLNYMKRSLLEGLNPIQDHTETTRQVRTIFENMLAATSRSEDFTNELWKELSVSEGKNAEDLKHFGKIIAINLIEFKEEERQKIFLYHIEFEKAHLLQKFTFDEQNKVSSIKTESAELK